MCPGRGHDPQVCQGLRSKKEDRREAAPGLVIALVLKGGPVLLSIPQTCSQMHARALLIKVSKVASLLCCRRFSFRSLPRASSPWPRSLPSLGPNYSFRGCVSSTPPPLLLASFHLFHILPRGHPSCFCPRVTMLPVSRVLRAWLSQGRAWEMS